MARSNASEERGSVNGLSIPARNMSSTILKTLFVGLLFHLFLLGVLNYFGVPTFILSVFRFWKEVLLFALFFAVLIVPNHFRRSPRLNAFDWAVLALASIGIIYFLFFSPYSELMVSKFNELRIYLYICVIYWIGRSIEMNEHDAISIVRVFSSAVLISGILSVLNQLFFGHGLIALADSYSASFSVGSEYVQAVTTEDLINTFYTPYSQIRNLNGSYLSLGNTLLFANVFFLTSHLFQKRKQDLYCFLLGTFILVLTGARAATLICAVISLVILTFHYRKPSLAVGMATGFFLVFVSIPNLVEKFSDAINDIADLEGGGGHIGGWNNFLDAFVERPFGYGFGVSERSAAEFGAAQLIGGESNFSHIAGNLGIFGGLVWLTMLILSWVRASRLQRSAVLPEMSILAFTGLCVSGGYFAISLTQYLNDNLEASLPLWFLIGWVGVKSHRS